jgi:DNA primase
MTDPVLDLLNKNNVAFKISGRDYVAKCFNPEHDDSNPSFRIDRLTGVAHCFSCGFKTNIFKYFGVFTNPVPIKIAKLKQKIRELSKSTAGLDMPVGAVPYTKPYRGLSPRTLKHFQAFYTNQVEMLQDRIVFPIWDITQKIQVFVARHILSSGNPRYVNYPGGVQIPLFPPQITAKTTSIVLVEGIFDMLNLYDKGLDIAVCCFGTNTIQNDIKNKLFPYKVQGITKIYIMFDADEAGQRATKELKPLIEEQGFLVETITLPEGMDPGELDQESVTQIREYIGYAHETNSTN